MARAFLIPLKSTGDGALLVCCCGVDVFIVRGVCFDRPTLLPGCQFTLTRVACLAVLVIGDGLLLSY